MAGKLDGKRIAFLVAPEGVEQVELTEPWKAVESEGGTPELVSTEAPHVGTPRPDEEEGWRAGRMVGGQFRDATEFLIPTGRV